jgi:hypothetical protein
MGLTVPYSIYIITPPAVLRCRTAPISGSVTMKKKLILAGLVVVAVAGSWNLIGNHG